MKVIVFVNLHVSFFMTSTSSSIRYMPLIRFLTSCLAVEYSRKAMPVSARDHCIMGGGETGNHNSKTWGGIMRIWSLYRRETQRFAMRKFWFLTENYFVLGPESSAASKGGAFVFSQ